MAFSSHSAAAAPADRRARRSELLPFDGRDFGLWKLRAVALFMAEELLDVVETEVAELAIKEEQLVSAVSASASAAPSKAERAARDEAIRRSHRAYGLLVQALQDEQLRLMRSVLRGNAHGVWRVLLDTYERKSMASRVQLLEQLLTLTLREKESIAAYVSRLMEIERRLQAQDEQVSESIQVYVLLHGLPPSYTAIVQWIKMKEDDVTLLGSIEAIKNEEERQAYRGQTQQRETRTIESANEASEIRRCYSCGKAGHLKFDCPRNDLKTKCSRCHRIGHREEDCKISRSEQANSAYDSRFEYAQ